MNRDIQIAAIAFRHFRFPDDPVTISELGEGEAAILIGRCSLNNLGSIGIQQIELDAGHGIAGSVGLSQRQNLRNVHESLGRFFRIHVFLIYSDDVLFAGEQVSIRSLGFTDGISSLFHMRKADQAVFIRNSGHDLFAVLVEQAKLSPGQDFLILGKLQHQDLRRAVIDHSQRFPRINEGSVHGDRHARVIPHIPRQRLFFLNEIVAVGHLFKDSKPFFIRDCSLDQIIGFFRIQAKRDSG